MRILAARLGTMLATIVIAPSLSFAVFVTLSADRFDPPETVRELVAWQKALFLHGDLGFDSYFGMPIADVLRQTLPIDLTMLLGGLLTGLIAGGAAGLRAVRHPASRTTRTCNVVAGLAMASPVYWMGFVVLILFAHNSGILVQVPFVSGQADFDTLTGGPFAILQALWVPILVCAAPLGAGVYRMTIAASREVQAAYNVPGSFRYMVDALANNNLDYIQALVVEGCILIAVANTAADLLQARIDPRVR